MADFNPQFETPDPSYLRYSKPIDQPQSDKSTGMLLQGVGAGIDEGVGLADKTFKDVIKKEIDTKTDAAKDDFLTQLDQYKQENGTTGSKPGTGNPLDANASASEIDLMHPGDNIPGDVQKGLDTVQSLANAKSQSKFKSTNLDANLTDILKDLRNRYPGYRDYIDEQGSKIIGYNPANKLINDKISELNAQQANASKEQDYWEKQITTSGYTGSQEILAKFQRDHNISAVQQWYAGNAIAHQTIADKKAAFELADKDKSDLNYRAETLANTVATQATVDPYRNKRFINDDPTSYTSAEIQSQLFEMSQKPDARNADTIRNLGTQLKALEVYTQQNVRIALTNAKTKDGFSVAQVLGPKKVQEIINNNITQVYGPMHDMLENQNVGLVHSAQNAITDVVDTTSLRFLQDPTTHGVMATGAAINKLFPTISPTLVDKIWGHTIKLPNGQPIDLADQLLKLSSIQKQQGLAQTGGAYAGVGNRNVYTFGQAMDEQTKAATAVHSNDNSRAMAIQDVLGLKQALKEKDPRAVDAGISFFFDPANQASLSKWIKEDYYDPSKGVVKGVASTVADLTDHDTTKAVWDRARGGNPLAWENYQKWTDRQIIPALTTMAKTWNTNESQLANQQTIHGAEGAMPSGTDHHFYYDSDTHQVGVTDLKGKPIDVENSYRLNPDIFMVRNANIYFKSLANIAEREGSDANAYIFQRMHQAGWAPPSLDVKGKSTVSDRLIKAVISSQKPEEKKEDK